MIKSVLEFVDASQTLNKKLGHKTVRVFVQGKREKQITTK